MKSITTIREIVNNMTEDRFNKIVKAESDYWELDSKISRNGYKRLTYHLHKEGLTVEEWFVWCDD